MARNGPLYTLLSGAVLGVGLLVAAMVATPDETAAENQEPAVEATETQTADEPTQFPEPTPETTTEPAPSPTETETAEPVT
jgi:hypothetical protein